MIEKTEAPSCKTGDLLTVQIKAHKKLVCFTKYYYSDWVKQNEMSGTCSMHGEMKYAYENLVGSLKGW